MFKKLNELTIGTRGTYLWDYENQWNMTKVMELPEAVAKAWFTIHNLKPYPLKYNKEWMVVNEDVMNDSWVVIYNLDGVYYLYLINYTEA